MIKQRNTKKKNSENIFKDGFMQGLYFKKELVKNALQPTAITNNMLLDFKELVEKIENDNDCSCSVVYERTTRLI